MAIDWIKMRIGLADDPAVIAIARTLKIEPDHVCGKLMTFWGWADQNTSTGRLDGVDETWIDAKVSKRGFAKALASVNPPWLLIDSSGVTIPNFNRHNGTSGKSRAENSRRQSVSRNSRDKSVTDVTKSCDESATRKEKKRILSTTSDGDWSAARQKANEIAAKLGKAYDERDRRLLLGCCYFCQEIGDEWLTIAFKTTQAAKPEKPYAYLQTLLVAEANDMEIDLLGSLSRLSIPTELLERRKHPCPTQVA